MNFRLAPSAISDIEAILRHLRAESPMGSIAVAARFDEVFHAIEDFPGLGKRTSRKGMRWINTYPYPYLIFYKTSSSLTEIVAVRHGAQPAVHARQTSLTLLLCQHTPSVEALYANH